MPRLFTALEIPQEVSFALSLKKGGLPGARWIDTENHHITLRFIGNVSDRTADEIIHTLTAINRAPFELSITNLGVFCSRKPHALWAGVNSSPALISLQAEQERLIQSLGLPVERRKYTPHVTLARLRGTSHAEVARYLDESGDFTCRPFRVERFKLLSSRASMGGGPYITEATFDLQSDQEQNLEIGDLDDYEDDDWWRDDAAELPVLNPISAF